MGFEVGFVPYNPDGWGPPEAATAPLSLGGGSASVPFAPFSRSEKLGRIADWTRNQPGAAAFAASRDTVFDFAGLEDSAGLASADDASFRLVDGKPLPRPPRFGPRWRFQQRPQLPQRRDEEVEARRREAEKERDPPPPAPAGTPVAGSSSGARRQARLQLLRAPPPPFMPRARLLLPPVRRLAALGRRLPQTCDLAAQAQSPPLLPTPVESLQSEPRSSPTRDFLPQLASQPESFPLPNTRSCQISSTKPSLLPNS